MRAGSGPPGYSGRAGISASHAVGPSLGRDFHVYSVAWDPGQIRWYVNDELYHAVTPAELNGKPWVFDHEFFLLVNVAVGGTASVPPDTSVTFPQTMLIDYVRLYEPAARQDVPAFSEGPVTADWAARLICGATR